MLVIPERYVGAYPLRATVTDADSAEMTVTSPAVTIENASGEEVTSGTPTADGTDLLFSVPVDDITVGVFQAIFTGTVSGEEQEWRVWFEIREQLETSPTELLPDAKLALRLASTAYDAEIERLIAAAKLDLKMGGVAVAAVEAVSPAPLIRTAVVTYCKAHFGLDNPDSDKYLRSYDSIKTSLALSTEYKEPPA